MQSFAMETKNTKKIYYFLGGVFIKEHTVYQKQTARGQVMTKSRKYKTDAYPKLINLYSIKSINMCKY
jgi:hypothetical protein